VNVNRLECPQANGTIFTTANKEAFLVICDVDTNAGAPTSPMTSTLDDCIESCANTPGCVWVSWAHAIPEGALEGNLSGLFLLISSRNLLSKVLDWHSVE